MQKLIKEILATEKVNSKESSGAISMSSADSTERFLKEKGVPDKYLEKVRSMCHLLAVEMHRGPEVAVGTALAHRLSRLGYGHITDYPRDTPLGPPRATTELGKARKRSRREIRQEGEPTDFAYIAAAADVMRTPEYNPWEESSEEESSEEEES